MRCKVFALVACVFVLAISSIAYAEEAAGKAIPRAAKIFISPMPDGFDEYLKAAIEKKKVPVAVVEDKNKAEFEITGHSETQKASTAKKVIMWNWHSNEQASIQVSDLKTSEVVFAYSVNKLSSAHGRKSTAEACAKHLKEKIESGR
jgi:hypothetical protein